MLKDEDKESFERILEKEMTQYNSGSKKRKKTFTLDEFDEEDLEDVTNTKEEDDDDDDDEEATMN
jgi:hypothetical protein